MGQAFLLSRARLVALLVPVALLGGALASQYIGGLFPCEMCMWQRWPHLAAIGAALAAFLVRRNSFASAVFTLLAALAIATSGAIGVFHAGVEYGWWEGLTTCATSAPPVGKSLLDAIMEASLVRCDVAPWDLFGISLAGFNAIFSLAGAALVFVLVMKGSRA
ncbi:MAG TPA: disulfide bond formation protein B [Sphingobium sp.]|nr:disulfide bond formation protein B [Sphingobium sp.]